MFIQSLLYHLLAVQVFEALYISPGSHYQSGLLTRALLFFSIINFFFFFFLRSYQILGLIFSHQPIVFFFSTSLSSRDFVCGKIATTALEIILCLQHVLEFHVKTECLSWWQGIFSPYLSLSNWLRLSWKYPQSEYSWLQSRLKRLLLYTFPARACSTSFFCYKHWFLGKSGCKFGLPYPYHNIR